MDDPPQRSSPIISEDVVAVGRAGGVEGRRAAFWSHKPRRPVAQTHADTGAIEALREQSAGPLRRWRDLEHHGPRNWSPGRVVPPAAMHQARLGWVVDS